MNFLDEDGLRQLWQQVKSLVSSVSNIVSGHTTQLSDLNLRTVQHSNKSIVCTTDTAPDAQGRLVGKTGFYAGQAVYMGVQATYVFFAASDTTGTLVVYGQGVGTKGGGTMANQIMYSRTAANAWTKLGRWDGAECPECPERLRLMRNGRNARSGCALDGAASPWPEWDGMAILC